MGFRGVILLELGSRVLVVATNSTGAYTVWSQGRQGSPGSTTFDVLAGARWWHQEVDVSADLTTTLSAGGPSGLTISGSCAIAKSGGIDWVDPFVGARVQHQLAPGQAIQVRCDVVALVQAANAHGRALPPITGR